MLALGFFCALACGGLAQQQTSLTDQYRDAAGRLIGAALVDKPGWEKLTYLTTVIGHRLSGSPQLERAVAWAADAMRADGLDNVRLQLVKVPHWVRGREYVSVVAPMERPLPMLGLGGSIATPPEGITAPVVVVSNFDELEALGQEKISGKIVLYDVPWTGYGPTVRYRSIGAARAAKLGAVGMLLRSVTDRSLYTPHTGAMDTRSADATVPAAAITVEDSAWIHRMADAGREVRVKLYMEAKMLPDADSANVIGEITGREKPEEVVVMGGHFDSWDVGQGAQDDGASCIAAWQALTILKQLGLKPRRTLRVVLWTNEENGLRGGQAYRESLGADISSHIAAIEMDGGAEKPVGFGLGLAGVDPNSKDPRYEAAMEKLKQIGRLLEGIEAGEITRGGGGADIGPLMRDGVPGLGQRTIGERYFDWHHTNADTLDKIDPQNFRKAVAMLAVMGYVLADMPERLVEAAK
ncbi:MAG: M20/M25/M40 family metallo-hydrolase [Acidobacteria bacterium]|nr:M20/M25/M40 family metallo-hydrolase [Acidobacteriota bacterium]MBI3663646.1 M20/M25/M40 family metallo-hydrolase [Acidobacteriota bacterium]